MKKILAFHLIISLWQGSGLFGSDWTNPAGGDWASAGNWDTGVPNAINAVANFTTDPTSSSTITSSVSPITLGTLNIDLSTASLTFTVPEFIFQTSSGDAAINVGANQSHIFSGTTTQANSILDLTVGSNSTMQFSSAQIYGTVNKNGSGTLLFTGSSFSNLSLNINQGIVQAGESSGDSIGLVSNLPVNPGTFLLGFGTINQGLGVIQVINSGTVEPGNFTSTGELSIGAVYTQLANGQLTIKALNTSTHDLLNVFFVGTGSGTATLDGTLFLDAPNSTFSPGEQITVLTAQEGLSGQFSQFTQSLPLGISASLIYDPNDVIILFGATPPSLLTYINLADPLFLIENGHMEQLSRRLEKLRCRTGSCCCKNLCCGTPKGCTSFYITPLGSWGEMDSFKGQEGYDFNSAGVILGGDIADRGFGWGGYISYEHVDSSVHDDWGHFKVQNLLGKLYGTFAPIRSRFFANAAVGGGYNWFTVNRNTTGLTAKGTPRGGEFNAWGEIGWDWNLGRHLYTVPLASLDYTYLYIGSYSESGADPFGVHVHEQNVHSLRSYLGCTLGGSWCFKGLGSSTPLNAVPEIRVAWEHEFQNDKRDIIVSALSYSSAVEIDIFPAGHDFGVIGGALTLYTTNCLSVTGCYDYTWNSAISINQVYCEMAYTF